MTLRGRGAEGGLHDGEADVRSFRDAERARGQDLSVDRAGEGKREGPEGNERGDETRRARRGPVRRDGRGRATGGDPRPHAPSVRREGRALCVRPEQAGAGRRGGPREGDGLDRDPRPGKGEARARRLIQQAPRDEEGVRPPRNEETRWRTRTASPRRWSRSSAERAGRAKR